MMIIKNNIASLFFYKNKFYLLLFVILLKSVALRVKSSEQRKVRTQKNGQYLAILALLLTHPPLLLLLDTAAYPTV
jgi:hypothetical protein